MRVKIQPWSEQQRRDRQQQLQEEGVVSVGGDSLSHAIVVELDCQTLQILRRRCMLSRSTLRYYVGSILGKWARSLSDEELNVRGLNAKEKGDVA